METILMVFMAIFYTIFFTLIYLGIKDYKQSKIDNKIREKEAKERAEILEKLKAS